MKAIILSAGQGRRLLPLTASTPKCLLPVDGERTGLDVQLAALAACGVRKAIVMVGFGADRVEKHLAEHPVPGIEVETRFNPFFESSDNLVTCWLASRDMEGEFLLLNGDTLFEAELLARVLGAPVAPITVTIDRKPEYDADDMKVSLLKGRRLRAIGKKLDSALPVDGEAIGLIRFLGMGGRLFGGALDAAVRSPGTHRAWYLSVVNEIAQRARVETCSIEGAWWAEIDSPSDLAAVRAELEGRRAAVPARRAAGAAAR
ncbi:MAG TPA: sugar phosphate nucleotidyltransferase [Myxococcota bacterium]|jgi:choline kinase|nr:sugar phosphate nucleotidyltransferase [Myxococcota bacterium]